VTRLLDSALWFFLVPMGVSLVGTIVVEETVALFMGFRRGRDLIAVAAVNLVTNPFVVWAAYLSVFLLFRAVGALGNAALLWLLVPVVVALELCAVLAEWLLLRWALKTGSRATLKLSFVMNATSFAAGLVAGAVWALLAFPR